MNDLAPIIGTYLENHGMGPAIDFQTQKELSNQDKKGMIDVNRSEVGNRKSPKLMHRSVGLGMMGVGVLAFAAAGAVHAQEGTSQAEAEQVQEKKDSAASASSTTLDTVVVKGRSAADAAKAVLNEVPGGVSIRRGEDVERRRALSIEDALNGEPGVFAQSSGGTDAIKISIRGSAINQGAGVFRNGTYFYFDGLPITGPGGTPYELFEPLGLAYTEVLRGANAFQYGALSIGGGINFVTNTGKTAPGISLRQEVGSYNWRKTQVAIGKDYGDLDYYVSYTNSARDGYQPHSYSRTEGIVANVGFKVSDDVDTRFFYRQRAVRSYNPGYLTLDQLNNNPRQAAASSVLQDSQSDKEGPGARWLANKTNIRIDENNRLELGAVYHDYNQVLYSEGATAAPNKWNWVNLNLSARYFHLGSLWDLPSTTSVGLFSTRQTHAEVHTYAGIAAGTSDYGYNTSKLYKVTRYTGSANNAVNFSNDLQLTQKLTLSTGLTWANVIRNVHTPYELLTAANSSITVASTLPLVNAYGTGISKAYNAWAPRLGLKYDVSPGVSVFGNASRSIDPPADWYSAGSGTYYVRPIDLQKANTYEVGTRFEKGRSSGSVTVYRSYVKNEILQYNVQVLPLPNAPTSLAYNGTPTIHQGIEAGLDTLLWSAKVNSEEKLSLRQSYTLNDFYFENDPTYGSNKLPGVPRHYYTATLEYSHPSGFYGGPNVQLASSYYTDYANTFKTPGYGLIGFSTGYVAPGKKWSVFLDVKNLADKHYVAVTNTLLNYSTTAASGQNIFSPGDGLSAYLGFSYKFD